MQAMVVKRKVAMNPVARAVMLNNLRKVLRDNRIQVYLMDDGEDCREFAVSVGMTISVIAYAYELDPAIQAEFRTEHSVAKGGLSALAQMSDSGKWRKVNATAVVRAIDAVEAINKKVSIEAISEAFVKLNAIQ